MLEKSLFTSAANLEPCSVTGANRDVFVLRYCQGTSHLLCDVSISGRSKSRESQIYTISKAMFLQLQFWTLALNSKHLRSGHGALSADYVCGVQYSATQRLSHIYTIFRSELRESNVELGFSKSKHQEFCHEATTLALQISCMGHPNNACSLQVWQIIDLIN